MFSREFADLVDQAVAAVQSGAPQLQVLANVFQGLAREVRRLNQQVSVSDGEIALKVGSASIILKADGSIEMAGKDITVTASVSTLTFVAPERPFRGCR